VGEPRRFVARLGRAEGVTILGGSYTAHAVVEVVGSVVDIHTGSPAPAAPAKMAVRPSGRGRRRSKSGPRVTGQRMLLRQFLTG
jgi:hypothetical protein